VSLGFSLYFVLIICSLGLKYTTSVSKIFLGHEVVLRLSILQVYQRSFLGMKWENFWAQSRNFLFLIVYF
jgi:hypothetical protein